MPDEKNTNKARFGSEERYKPVCINIVPIFLCSKYCIKIDVARIKCNS